MPRLLPLTLTAIPIKRQDAEEGRAYADIRARNLVSAKTCKLRLPAHECRQLCRVRHHPNGHYHWDLGSW